MHRYTYNTHIIYIAQKFQYPCKDIIKQNTQLKDMHAYHIPLCSNVLTWASIMFN